MKLLLIISIFLVIRAQFVPQEEDKEKVTKIGIGSMIISLVIESIVPFFELLEYNHHENLTKKIEALETLFQKNIILITSQLELQQTERLKYEEGFHSPRTLMAYLRTFRNTTEIKPYEENEQQKTQRTPNCTEYQEDFFSPAELEKILRKFQK